MIYSCQNEIKRGDTDDLGILVANDCDTIAFVLDPPQRRLRRLIFMSSVGQRRQNTAGAAEQAPTPRAFNADLPPVSLLFDPTFRVRFRC